MNNTNPPSDPQGIDALLARIQPSQDALFSHPLYGCINTLDDLRRFMEFHVFAVWDFMSLLKDLQRHLTCVAVPWRPVGSASARRFINEIVLGEESDEVDGVVTGHFELYLDAMRDAGADTGPIRAFVQAIGQGVPVAQALVLAGAPLGAQAFVRDTFAVIETGKPHMVASAFTYGREDPIPEMFGRLGGLVAASARETRAFNAYLARHIELDGDDHGPKAVALLQELCGTDGIAWQEAAAAAEAAVQSRLRLWSAIEMELAALATAKAA